MLKMPDIYFLEDYGRLYEEIEEGQLEIFEYESSLGLVRNMFIKRKIPINIEEKSYYDITTPYGYGGPIVLKCENTKDRKELIKEYKKSFKEYCRKNDIVSEFIRFHPVIGNYKDFDEVYDVEYMRRTLGTNLKDYEDPFQEEFSKSCRKSVRRALRDGVTFEIEEDLSKIDEFIKIYNSTMDRNDASEYYYFGENYFKEIVSYFKSNVIIAKAVYEEKTIASGLYFIYENIIHMHLSGTLDGYLNLSPAYILKYGITKWGKEKGYELIHHGGGTSNSEEDSLYKFKKKFANNTEFDFYIGKKIWNNETYNQLCKLKGVDSSIDFFPAYRKKL